MNDNIDHPTESQKAVMLENAKKSLEGAEDFLLIVLNKNGIKEYRSFKPTRNIGMTLLRILAKLTEDCWKAIDTQTGRAKKDQVKNYKEAN